MFLFQMNRHAMMMGKCTRWETSGKRNIWVPSVPVPATEDSRCVCVPLYVFVYVWMYIPLSSWWSRLFRYTNLPILPFRAGVVRTAEGQEDILMSMLTFFSLSLQMPLTGTEKTLYVNWSVSHYRFYY